MTNFQIKIRTLDDIQAAQIAGVKTTQAVYKWKKLGSIPHPKTLLRFAQHWDCTIEWLISEVGKK